MSETAVAGPQSSVTSPPSSRQTQQVRTALICETFQPNTSAPARSGGPLPAQPLTKGLSALQLARVSLHVGSNQRIVLLRNRAQAIPIQPFLSNVPDIPQVLGSQ